MQNVSSVRRQYEDKQSRHDKIPVSLSVIQIGRRNRKGNQSQSVIRLQSLKGRIYRTGNQDARKEHRKERVMNVYLVLSFMLVGVLSAIIGMVVQAFIDHGEYRALETAYISIKKKNEQLETENTLLIDQVNPTVVEVIHKHVIENNTASDVDFSQKW